MPPNKKGEELNELSDVDVLEVSLVAHGANRAKFLLIKNEEGGETMPEKEVVVEQEQPAGESPQTEKKVGEKLSALVDGLGPEDLKALMKLCSDKLGEEYGEPKEAKKAEAEDVQKAELDPETKQQIETLFKAKEQLEVEIKKAQADAAHERDLRLGREYLEKARTFKGLPGKPEDLGVILKSLAAVNPELYSKVEGLLAAASVALEKSALMQEFGTAQSPQDTSAIDELMRKARELVQKSEGKTSLPDAIVALEKIEPELYLRYMQEARRVR